MDRFEFGMAGTKVHDVIWNEFCDWYIELVKSRLYGDDEEDKAVARAVLVSVLKDLLKLLHPYMPFITEEIWRFLPGNEGYLIADSWPVYNEAKTYTEESAVIEKAMEVIKAIRNIRAEAEASPGRKLSAVILAEGEAAQQIASGERYVRSLANITDIKITADKAEIPSDVMSAVITEAEVHIPLDELVDFEAELERLTKEKKKLEGEVKRGEKMLSNEGFISKAPEAKIQQEKDKLANYKDMLAKVEERLVIIKNKIG
jgi:valyl-tRNA synthetase